MVLKVFLPRDALYALYSAKHGIEIAYRHTHVTGLSVCPSVTLADQDHIGSKSWNRTSFDRSPKVIHLFAGEHGKFWGD